ncbi:hypothetical protein VSK92_05100 [Bacillus swezeyi]|uniref:hypothetical protein n=1 Tax=Bacillus swezeyi TaxID=1925020 RepID=UPI0039C5BAE4
MAAKGAHLYALLFSPIHWYETRRNIGIKILKTREYMYVILFILQSTKTKSGNRNIAITNEDIEELKAYKIKKQEQLLKVGMNVTVNHFVISAFGGEPVNPNTIL